MCICVCSACGILHFHISTFVCGLFACACVCICVLPVGWGLSVGLVLLCLAHNPLPCNRACRGLCSLGGGTQRSPLAQLSVYTPQGSPWASTKVLPAAVWSLGGRPAPIGSRQEGHILKGPKRFAQVQDPQWPISNRTMVVKLEIRGILCPGLRFSSLSLSVICVWCYFWMYVCMYVSLSFSLSVFSLQSSCRLLVALPGELRGSKESPAAPEETNGYPETQQSTSF